MRLNKVFLTSSLGGVVGILAVGWRNRPLTLESVNNPSKPERNGWMAKQFFTDNADQELNLALKIARQCTIAFGVSLLRLYLQLAGDFRIIEDGNYYNFLELVKKREGSRPLLTISNHRSLIDDPGVLSNILPFHMNIQPRYVRYSLCAQEYCFNAKVNTFKYHLNPTYT